MDPSAPGRDGAAAPGAEPSALSNPPGPVRTEARGGWGWYHRAGIFAAVMAVAVIALGGELGATFTPGTTAQLQVSLIQADGLLIAFSGIIFTGMLAEVRTQIDRASRDGDPARVQRLDTASFVLRVCAFGAFVLFAGALIASLGTLEWALGTTVPRSVPDADAIVLSGAFFFAGIAFLLLALAELAFGLGIPRATPRP